jgi:kumamolisin
MTAEMPPKGFKALTSSERNVLPGSQQVGPVDPHERLEVSIYLRAPAASDPAGDSQLHAQRPGQRMSREEYLADYGADYDDLAKVTAFAQRHGLTVVQTDVPTRKVVLAGTTRAMMAAFATDLQRYEYQGSTFRGRSGYLYIPDELDQIVVGVFGLDDRPQASSHTRYYTPLGIIPSAYANAISYTPPQVAQLYDFPTGVDGTGQCVALIELGGGYKTQDLSTYFNQLGIKMPQVVSVSVDGGQNTPTGDPNSADGEVALDIEMVGGIAPGARIAVYFAPNTDRGFLDAITQAIHDTTNAPSIISISWGGPESGWTAQAMQTMDQAFQAAAALGITVCCAAGDNGSGDGVNDQHAHVDFPSSSPYALGCGGTRLAATGGKVTAETVWNDAATNGGATGGGISDQFGLPTWQAGVHIPPSVNNQHVGRGVPDVAGDADPQTGYQVYVDGQSTPIGGTSAVAPLWAGLLALVNQKRGKAVGYLNPFLYQHYQQLAQSQALRDIVTGNNGAYNAGPGWDACTGLGTPDGSLLLAALAAE